MNDADEIKIEKQLESLPTGERESFKLFPQFGLKNAFFADFL